MKSKYRISLVAACVIVFFLGGTYIITNALGYVITFNPLKISATGSIYLSYLPRSAGVIIQNKPVDARQGFIDRSLLLRKIKPGIYDVVITEPGFIPFRKIAAVKPGLVTKFTDVELWKERHSTSTPIEGYFQNIYLTGEGLLTQNKSNVFRFNSYTIRGTKILKYDSDRSYVITKDNETIFVTDLSNPLQTHNLSSLFTSLKTRELALPGNVPILLIDFHPQNRDILLISTRSALYALDIKNIALSLLSKYPFDNPRELQVTQNFIYVLSNQSYVQKIELQNTRNTASFALPNENVHNLKVFKDDKLIYTDHENETVVFSMETRTAKTIKVKTDGYSLAQNRPLLMIKYKTNQELALLTLEEFEDDIKYTEYEVYELDSLDPLTPINEIAWLTKKKRQFVFLADGTLYLAEADPRMPTNFTVIAREVSNFTVDEKGIYYLNNKGEVVLLLVE